MNLSRQYVINAIILASSFCSWSTIAQSTTTTPPPACTQSSANTTVYTGNTSIFVPFVPVPSATSTILTAPPKINVGFANSGNQVMVAGNNWFPVTMDTGSVGIYLGSDYFKPPVAGKNDPSYIGSGGETLTSSGIQINGDWYNTQVNIFDLGGNALVTATVPVLAVTSQTCTSYARNCSLPSAGDTGSYVKYFGVGFGQETAGQPQGTPEKNPLLNITANLSGSGLPSPGYIITSGGVYIGLTPQNSTQIVATTPSTPVTSSSAANGFSMIKLQPLLSPAYSQWQTTPPSSSNCVLTDWQHPVGVLDVNNQTANASILFDTGVGTGYLTPPANVTVNTNSDSTFPAAQCNNNSSPSSSQCAISGTKVKVSFPGYANGTTTEAVIASFQYSVDGIQATNPLVPIGLAVVPNQSPYLNTTFNFFNAFNYLYDAANGFIGLQAKPTISTQYATSTPGLSFYGTFQCVFQRIENGLVKTSTKEQITLYSPPYTYRYYTNNNNPVYIGVSSGVDSNTVNNLYILNDAPGSSNPRSQGSLSSWLSVAGCQ